MTEHPITPPPELANQWSIESEREHQPAVAYSLVSLLATKAARWGADQELEACCEWLRHDLDAYELVGLRAVYLDHNLRAARRPNPPSLKEQALTLLDDASDRLDAVHENTIRRALESLPD